MSHLLMVTKEMVGVHPRHTEYPLLEGDVLVLDDDGTYCKVAPGLGVGGFTLAAAQVATLKPIDGHVAIVGNL